MTWLIAILNWLRNTFVWKRAANVAADTKTLMSDLMKRLKNKMRKHRGTMIWDAQKFGTYRRKTRKIGRNEPCPCGAMREAPRDTTKPAKYKHCCGVSK